MKLSVKILIIALLACLFGTETSYSAEQPVNISADVPSGEQAIPGSVVPVYDSDPPQIFDVQISSISFDGASVGWKTNENSSAYLYYGKTLSYETGILEDHAGSLTSSHKIEIRNLEENTLYYFQLRSSDSAGNQSIKDGYDFKTLAKKISPENVAGLKAIAGDSMITLYWKNPPNSDFDKVIIARSEIFYPKNSEGGFVVYSGKDESFADEGLANGTKYYYSVFSFDLGGNISSGAAVTATPNKGKAEEKPPENPEKPPEKPIIPPDKPMEPEMSPDIGNITISDFVFMQDGVKIDLKDGKIEIDPDKEITVSIGAEKIPDSVDSVMIILTRENEEYSYLMKEDERRGIYSASVKLASGGSFDITIVLLDHENRIMKAMNGSISPVSTIKKPEERFLGINYLFLFLILFLILISYKIVKKLSKKRRDRKKLQNPS